MSNLLFEYKVRYRYKTGYKEFSFYATTKIEEFLNRNNIEYVRNATDTVESRLFKEIERLKYNEKTLADLLDKEQKKNKKAIEYIEKEKLEIDYGNGVILDTYELSTDEVKDLLEILKGE